MTEPLRSARAARTAPATRPAPDAPRHLRVVEPRTGRLARVPRARIVVVVGTGLLLAVALGLVYLHVVLAQRQIQLDSLNARMAQDQATYQNLRLEVADLDSPQQIISTAEGKLGMRQPASVTYLSPPTGSSSSANKTSGSGLGLSPRGATVLAPEGDADWPRIKADLAGSP
jgi:cell division protein FtsL